MENSSKGKVCVGVIGLGGVANYGHLPGYQEAEGAKLVACDILKEHAEEVAGRYGIPSVFTNYREMLKMVSFLTKN